MVAATSARSESDVVSDAIRAYLQSDGARDAATEIRELLQRVNEHHPVTDDDEAMKNAVAEVSSHRKRSASK
jgi:metal-responsive CopG/Arc/MetJ family transcriptional regulator